MTGLSSSYAQTLNQQISRGATFFTPQLDLQGMAAIMNAQAQAAQAEAQRRLFEEQAKALQIENTRRANASQDKTVTLSKISSPMKEWLQAASPRLHLFPDFEKVVFTQDLSITDDMIYLMAKSPLAADIAYYFGTHRIEALAISQMAYQDAARSVEQIESRILKTLK